MNENGGGFGRRHHSGKAIQMSNDNVEAVLSKQSMLEMANATRAILDGSTSQIEKIIREHDLGVGVFQDVKSDDGVGFHVIKGRKRLQAIAAKAPEGSTPIIGPSGAKLRVTAVPCVELEQAIVVQRMWGDPD